jgi:antitoxin ParD1/3/4
MLSLSKHDQAISIGFFSALAKTANGVKLSDMGTKNVSLTKELEAFVAAKVASGEYLHASEVMRDGLRLLMREEAEKLEWLRSAVLEGVADADSGDLLPAKEAFAEVKRHGRDLLKAKRTKRASRARR